MKYFLQFVIESLVSHRDRVMIDQVDTDKATIFYIQVHSEDIGRIIGKNGRTIGAIRTVINSAARDDRRVRVEIVED
jgi:predicted RNA-binding protein YlqC (UPF0109 family)